MAGWIQPHLAAAGGALRFDRFMELALYDPVQGYYSSRLPTIGSRGDFTTTPTLSGSLGRAVADWIRGSGARHVIEIGAGTGQLACSVLGSLPFLFRRRLRYHIVERSPKLRQRQQELLGSRAVWHSDLKAALAATRGKAHLFSNELVDAFPVRIFRPSSSGWEELWLEDGSEGLTERWERSDPVPEPTLLGGQWQTGQRLEIHESYHRWCEDWLPHWESGELLTIDYGGSPGEIYFRRPRGSLRAYLAHHRLEGAEVYRNPGRLDLTADVNFDALRKRGASRGLETVLYTTQGPFLAPHAGPGGADRHLLDPDGAGSAFKVLLQRRAGP